MMQDADGKITHEQIVEVFRSGNDAIAALNKGIALDYLEHDFAGCVAVWGVLKGDILYYGYIGDCGLLVYDSSTLMPVHITPNEVEALENFRDAQHLFVPLQQAREVRILHWTQTVRNRPGERYLTFGALTGEEEALSYVRTGSFSLTANDIAVFYSDGALPYLFARNFRSEIAVLLRSGGDITYGEYLEYCGGKLKAEAERSGPHLGRRGFRNLDDDKALIALQLVE